METELKEYITKNLEYSQVITSFVEMLTIINKKDSTTKIIKISPKELEEELQKEVWGLEITVSLVLGHEAYGKNELLLFSSEEERDQLYNYIEKFNPA